MINLLATSIVEDGVVELGDDERTLLYWRKVFEECRQAKEDGQTWTTWRKTTNEDRIETNRALLSSRSEYCGYHGAGYHGNPRPGVYLTRYVDDPKIVEFLCEDCHRFSRGG
jgi:hypothetical protein